MKYKLEKYRGRATRHECPRCHDKHSFTYYVDENGVMIDKSVGRCNHESSCGYHYTPKEWFSDNPLSERGSICDEASVVNKPCEPDFIPPDYVLQSSSMISNLAYYLSGLIPPDTIQRVWAQYGVGATKNKSVIYWQIDSNGKVRTGKVMRYNPETGHRIKGQGGVNWIHSIMIKRGLLPESFNLVQCLFGESLLKLYKDKPVGLVESEKTALICAALLPHYVWVATGGKSQMSPEKMRVLTGRSVVAFPDVDAFQEWNRRAVDLADLGINIAVSDVLELNATDEDRSKKIDIADWLLAHEQTPTPPPLQDGVSVALPPGQLLAKYMGNPAFVQLANALDLCEPTDPEEPF